MTAYVYRHNDDDDNPLEDGRLSVASLALSAKPQAEMTGESHK